jgi:hypothetical protein
MERLCDRSQSESYERIPYVLAPAFNGSSSIKPIRDQRPTDYDFHKVIDNSVVSAWFVKSSSSLFGPASRKKIAKASWPSGSTLKVQIYGVVPGMDRLTGRCYRRPGQWDTRAKADRESIGFGKTYDFEELMKLRAPGFADRSQ